MEILAASQVYIPNICLWTVKCRELSDAFIWRNVNWCSCPHVHFSGKLRNRAQIHLVGYGQSQLKGRWIMYLHKICISASFKLIICIMSYVHSEECKAKLRVQGMVSWQKDVDIPPFVFHNSILEVHFYFC